MDKLIITMPIKPYQKFSLGKMTTPILAETLAIKMNAKFILAVNLLDSYKEPSIDKYFNLLSEYQIKPDYCWIDKEHIDILLKKITYLIEQGYIYETEKTILTCSCHRVEIDELNIDTINQTDASFYQKENNYYCKTCNSLCYLKKEKVLVFNPKLIKNPTFNFYPEFINSDIKTFKRTILENEIIISRKRNTKIIYEYNQEKYYIDIDFLWQLYLSLFPNTEKIVICSNHQLYQLFMVSLLEKCFNNREKTICLATPYLNIKDKNIQQELESRILSLKIFTLLNQSFKTKENYIDEGLIRYINHMNISKKQQLYELILKESDNNLKDILTKEINKQRLNQELRRIRRKNV